MYYKELTRVKRGLLVLTIVLALFILIGTAASHDQGGAVHVQIGDQPPAHAATAAGSHTTAHSHIKAVTPHQPQTKAASGLDQNQIPLSLLFAIAAVIATIFAGAYGGSLASENSGHLEVAWTKPVSRSRYALTTIGVDLLAAWAAFGITFAAAIAVIAIGRMLGWVYVDGDAWPNLVRFLLLPVAFTGLWQALTASLKTHAGNVIGFSVVACVILLSLAVAPLPRIWHGLVDILNFINPMVYG
ncbi:MAG: hypothetical protein M3007_03280, partial [Candidatus Eremiobacteraeota bacterium]|nr:hypothetical protein [Candidatus Eremiobacteraeota bacterium]